MEEDESRKDDCEYSCTEQNGCAVEYTGPVEATSVTLVRVTISIKNKANAMQRLLRDTPHDPSTTGCPKKRNLSEFFGKYIKIPILGKSGQFRAILCILGKFGHFWAYWAFWANLGILGILGNFG